MPHPGILDIHPVQTAPFLRLRLLCAPTIPSPPCLPVSLFPAAQPSLIRPPLPAPTSPAQVQCPHQNSILKLLGLRLQLHPMLLEYSPLAQAPPDAVCGWVGGLLRAPPYPGHPYLPRVLQVWGQMRGEINRESFPSWVASVFLLERRGGVEKTLAPDVPESGDSC